MNIEGIITELKIMKEKLYEDLQAERRVVFEHNVHCRKWEKSLQKYDELAIRYDQIKKVFDLIDKQAAISD